MRGYRESYVTQPGFIGVLLQVAGLCSLPDDIRPYGLLLSMKAGTTARCRFRSGQRGGFEMDIDFSLTSAGVWLPIGSSDFVQIEILSLNSTTDRLQATWTVQTPQQASRMVLPVVLVAAAPVNVPMGASGISLNNADVGQVWTTNDGTGNVAITINYAGGGVVQRVLGQQLTPGVNNTGVWTITL